MGKQLNEMNTIEALDALVEGLEAIKQDERLPEFALIKLFVDRAKEAHVAEVSHINDSLRNTVNAMKKFN